MTERLDASSTPDLMPFVGDRLGRISDSLSKVNAAALLLLGDIELDPSLLDEEMKAALQSMLEGYNAIMETAQTGIVHLAPKLGIELPVIAVDETDLGSEDVGYLVDEEESDLRLAKPLDAYKMTEELIEPIVQDTDELLREQDDVVWVRGSTCQLYLHGKVLEFTNPEEIRLMNIFIYFGSINAPFARSQVADFYGGKDNINSNFSTAASNLCAKFKETFDITLWQNSGGERGAFRYCVNPKIAFAKMGKHTA